jgi:hypothetical protein
MGEPELFDVFSVSFVFNLCSMLSLGLVMVSLENPPSVYMNCKVTGLL